MIFLDTYTKYFCEIRKYNFRQKIVCYSTQILCQMRIGGQKVVWGWFLCGYDIFFDSHKTFGKRKKKVILDKKARAV